MNDTMNAEVWTNLLAEHRNSVVREHNSILCINTFPRLKASLLTQMSVVMFASDRAPTSR